MKQDVFISFSSRDKGIADAVCSNLEAANIRCWIAPRDIVPGDEWSAAIVEAIRSSRMMILIFSSHSDMSAQVRREVQSAFDTERIVIPFRIEAVDPGPALQYYLGPVQWFDAWTEPLEPHLDRLQVLVRQILAAPSNFPSLPSPRGDSERPERPSRSAHRTGTSPAEKAPPPISRASATTPVVASRRQASRTYPVSRLILGIGLGALICVMAAPWWRHRIPHPGAYQENPLPRQMRSTQASRGGDAATDSSPQSLLEAAQAGDPEAVKQVLERSTDVDVRDENGNTPLILAAERGDAPVVQVLLDRGAAVDAKNSEGRVALGRAVYGGHVEVVRLLLKRHADPNIRDSYHDSILRMAERERKSPEILALLREAGAAK